MMALSLWQPWASLIAVGAKRCETRGWPTKYRGPLAIQAAARWTRDEALMCWRPEIREALEAAGVEYPARELGYFPRKVPPLVPLGAAVAIVDLVDCIPTWPPPDWLDGREAAFGDWGPKRFAWRLENVVRLPTPVPMRGAQGLFVPTSAALDAIHDQLRGAA